LACLPGDLFSRDGLVVVDDGFEFVVVLMMVMLGL